MFYALPQAPQQYKQLLQVAGLEKYFQIARCFRDEDLRAERQLEFTQIDLEASFITEEDIQTIVEGLLARIFREAKGIEIPLPFPRLAYQEAMNRYGSDKPDTRFGMELTDLGGVFHESQFKVFRAIVDSGGAIKAIRAPGAAALLSKEQLKKWEEWVKTEFGAKGLAYIKWSVGGEWESPDREVLLRTRESRAGRAHGLCRGRCALLRRGQVGKRLRSARPRAPALRASC